MSHEVLYTSAQQGLKPGSFGFCTVMATTGISKVLQDRLESLSGYEHAFGLTDARAHLNPVNFSHLIVSLGSQKFHVLSRVADAGADYSGRSNKLAHHVALAPDELTQAGPAWALATAGFCKTAFDGAPRQIPNGVRPPASPRPFGKCTAWEQATGDAGWAGVIAETTLKNPARPITMIFREGTDVLPLVVEALSLLPPDRQWRTTFSTFYTKLPAGIDCQWRFVLEGTSAADAARRNLQFPPIVLKTAGPVPSAGPLVEAARSGTPPVATAASVPSATPVTVAPRTGTMNTIPDPVRVAPAMPAARPPKRAAASFVERHKLPLTIGGFAAFLMLCVVTVLYVNRAKGPVRTDEQQAGVRKLTPAINPDAFPDVIKSEAASEAVEAAEVMTERLNTPVASTVKPPEVQTEPETRPAEPPFKDINGRGKLLSLPQLLSGVPQQGNAAEICKVYTREPADCDLSLSTLELVDAKPRLSVERDPSPPTGTQTWTVYSHQRKSALGDAEPLPIAHFTLHDSSGGYSLDFAWDPKARLDEYQKRTKPFGLQYCKLDLMVGEESVRCNLFKPIEPQPVTVNLVAQRKVTVPVNVPANSLTTNDFLRAELELRRRGWSKTIIFKPPWMKAGNPPTEVSAAEKMIIPFEVPAGNGDVEVSLEFKPPEATQAEFAFRAFVFPTFLTPSSEAGSKRWQEKNIRIDRTAELEGAWQKIREFQYSLQIKTTGTFKPLLPESTKDGIQFEEFDALKKWSKDQQSGALKTTDALEAIRKGLEEKRKGLGAELARTPLNQERRRADLEAEIGKVQRESNDVRESKEEWDKFLRFYKNECDAWISAMKTHFNPKTEKVKGDSIDSESADLILLYAVYLDFNGERVTLTETHPPPNASSVKPSRRSDESPRNSSAAASGGNADAPRESKPDPKTDSGPRE